MNSTPYVSSALTQQGVPSSKHTAVTGPIRTAPGRTAEGGMRLTTGGVSAIGTGTTEQARHAGAGKLGGGTAESIGRRTDAISPVATGTARVTSRAAGFAVAAVLISRTAPPITAWCTSWAACCEYVVAGGTTHLASRAACGFRAVGGGTARLTSRAASLGNATATEGAGNQLAVNIGRLAWTFPVGRARLV
jgi:hypothetical protein